MSKNYLTKVLDWQEKDIVQAYDELPLWSAPFGLLLLEHFPIGEYEHYLDIGFGTGFPLIDIAQKLGENCQATGIDIWEEAIKRSQSKIDSLGIKNIKLINTSASNIPFQDNYFDLITSNLGVNNFDDPVSALSECYRVLKTNGSLCITSNLTGTFKEFYKVYKTTLKELELTEYLPQIDQHIMSRGTLDSKRELILNCGLTISKQIESTHHIRFLNGTAFLNHAFTNIAFIDSWRNMFSKKHQNLFFDKLEYNLNQFAKINGELKLSIPMVYFECIK